MTRSSLTSTVNWSLLGRKRLHRPKYQRALYFWRRSLKVVSRRENTARGPLCRLEGGTRSRFVCGFWHLPSPQGVSRDCHLSTCVIFRCWISYNLWFYALGSDNRSIAEAFFCRRKPNICPTSGQTPELPVSRAPAFPLKCALCCGRWATRNDFCEAREGCPCVLQACAMCGAFSYPARSRQLVAGPTQAAQHGTERRPPFQHIDGLEPHAAHRRRGRGIANAVLTPKRQFESITLPVPTRGCVLASTSRRVAASSV